MYHYYTTTTRASWHHSTRVAQHRHHSTTGRGGHVTAQEEQAAKLKKQQSINTRNSKQSTRASNQCEQQVINENSNKFRQLSAIITPISIESSQQ
jgi:predicted RNA-binding protein YlxR (DUF448 family)